MKGMMGIMQGIQGRKSMIKKVNPNNNEQMT